MSKNSLDQIVARLERLETAVFSQGSKRKMQATKSPSPKGLPSHIMKLRDQNFFGQAKTAGEVHGRLKSQYSCEHDRVAMALLRLQRRKLLRKASKTVDKKKQVAYVW